MVFKILIFYNSYFIFFIIYFLGLLSLGSRLKLEKFNEILNVVVAMYDARYKN